MGIGKSLPDVAFSDPMASGRTCVDCLPAVGLTRGGGDGKGEKLNDMCEGTTMECEKRLLFPGEPAQAMHPETGSSLQVTLACPEAALGQVARRWAGEGPWGLVRIRALISLIIAAWKIGAHRRPFAG